MKRVGMRRTFFFLIALSFSVCISLFFSPQCRRKRQQSPVQIKPRSNDRTDATPVATTKSPRQTIASFLVLRDAIEEAANDYVETRQKSDFTRILAILSDLKDMVDTSGVPEGEKRPNFDADGTGAP